MDKQKRSMSAGLIMLLFAGGTALGEDGIDFEVTVDFASKYIWRGQNLDDDAVFQPSIGAGYGDFTATIWGNLELTNMNGNSDFSELDYSLDYSTAMPGIEGIGYSLGVIYYDFPGTATPDTTELYWALNFDLLLNPSVTVYHDMDEAEGTYVSLGIGHSFEQIAELTADVTVGMDVGASLGWGCGSYDKYYWGTDQSKLNDLALSICLPVVLGNCTLTPSLSYVTLLSDDIRDTDAYGTDSDFFVAGVGLSKRF